MTRPLLRGVGEGGHIVGVGVHFNNLIVEDGGGRGAYRLGNSSAAWTRHRWDVERCTELRRTGKLEGLNDPKAFGITGGALDGRASGAHGTAGGERACDTIGSGLIEKGWRERRGSR